MPHRAKTLLIVEDEQGEQVLLRHAAGRAGIGQERLRVCNDGQEAMEYLQQLRANDAAHELPQAMVLDLKMPRVSGFDALAWLHTHPEFHSIPVIVLTNSKLAGDVNLAGDLGAAEYWQKPSGVAGLVRLMADLRERFLG